MARSKKAIAVSYCKPNKRRGEAMVRRLSRQLRQLRKRLSRRNKKCIRETMRRL